jgi:hypothetical protein
MNGGRRFRLVMRGESWLPGPGGAVRRGRADARDVEVIWKTMPRATLTAPRTIEGIRSMLSRVRSDFPRTDVRILARGHALQFSIYEVNTPVQEVADWLRRIAALKLRASRVDNVYARDANLVVRQVHVDASDPERRASLEAFMANRLGEIRGCLQSHLPGGPTAWTEGALWLTFYVESNGKFLDYMLDGPLGFPAQDCLRSKARDWRLDPSLGPVAIYGEYEVSAACSGPSCRP